MHWALKFLRTPRQNAILLLTKRYKQSIIFSATYFETSTTDLAQIEIRRLTNVYAESRTTRLKLLKIEARKSRYAHNITLTKTHLSTCNRNIDPCSVVILATTNLQRTGSSCFYQTQYRFTQHSSGPTPSLKNLRRQRSIKAHRNIVEPVHTKWALRNVFMPKRDWTLQLCEYKRKQNAVTKRKSYLIPLMDECIHSIGKSMTFLVLDTSNGYWQIYIKDADKSKAIITSVHGLDHFICMLFGLRNVSCTVQCITDVILSSFEWQFAHFISGRHCDLQQDTRTVYQPRFQNCFAPIQRHSHAQPQDMKHFHPYIQLLTAQYSFQLSRACVT